MGDTTKTLPYQAIFLDVDNTLLDFDGYVKETMREGFRLFGIGTYEPWMYDTFRQINDGLWRRIEETTLDFEELQQIRWNMIFDALGFSYDGPTFESYFRACLHTSAIPMKGAVETLQYLHGRGYLLAAASNGPHDQQVNRLRLGGMLPYIAQVFTSEQLGVSKPSPEFFRQCFHRLNSEEKPEERRADEILPEHTLMVGDSLTSDMDGGIAAGMDVCLVTAGRRALSGDGRALDYLVCELEELKHFL